jgi:hypothetical protein
VRRAHKPFLVSGETVIYPFWVVLLRNAHILRYAASTLSYREKSFHLKP